ncbi:MAG: eukaryotic-like serine/threonine-protein kinase [Thermoleophilaceae bacterium]|nr:eukaryotic-like serine/threonine-protein kinase [Thermoleophilaceae bacterium]
MAVSTTGRLLAGRYRTIRRLGAGGMATVYLAEDERLGRRVAVKRLHGDIADDDLARRFQREARLGASLNHPNVVAIYDIVPDDEGVLIVMEYVEGHTLRDEIASGPLDAGRALTMLRGVAEALDHAHENGVVHRDVKPANVLVRPDGTAKLADLGIATAAEQSQITRSGSVLGTAAYMAPERLEGGAGDRTADVYALAAVAYEALSGRKAVEGSTPLEVARRVVTQPPAELIDAVPAAPPGAAAALRRGLAKDPAERPRTAGELVDRLARAFDGWSPPAAPLPGTATTATVAMPATEQRQPTPLPPPAPPRTTHRSRRLPVLAALLAALLVSGLVVALSSGDSGQKTEAGKNGSKRSAKPKAKPASAPSSKAAAPSSAATAGGATPTAAVTSFYQDAAGHNYDAAWALSTDNLHNQVGGRQAFESSQSTLQSIRFPVMKTVGQSGSSATVQLQSEARHTDHVDHVCGTVSLVRGGSGWLLDQLHLDTCPGGGGATAAPGPSPGKTGKGPKPGKGPKAGKHGGSNGGD